MDYGVDVSHYNAVADANAVRNNGITFAWCKATEGTTYVDPTFANKVAQLKAAGIVVGAYHFLRAGDVAAQARRFRQVAGDAGCLNAGALLPMADMEANDVRGSANTAVTTFYDTLGVSPVDVYGNLDWWRNVLAPGQWGARAILGHIARYNGDPGNPGWLYGSLALHQHTSSGSVPGIPGNVDRNATIGTYNLRGLTIGQVAAPVEPVPLVPAPITGGDSWTVKRGDTLSRVASAWHMTVSAVAVANGITNPDLITVGQVIHRPGSASAKPAPAARTTYKIRAGDTLGAIARKYNTTVPALVALNHLSNPDRIYAGQTLTI
ncbi:LysM peptidoglycan-binding domain-containing protein [Amycolatopsis sp. CA-128772]|uniref:LysM peptidoglycan-binding domain-containing protein n=1 Tax=Amycolatopsis sp. CA-128772 TaxID=2073159 RepID=UPI000CD13C0E|nr:LysM peptidoglycan-binding domain-containing protein [Amycolatopsis sp. CA-128772]